VQSFRSDRVFEQVLLPSPRNPVATNVSLMEQTRSSRVVYPKEMRTLVDGICTATPDLRRMEISSLNELLRAHAGSFPFHLTFDQAVRQPIVILHSSGSTRLPEPVVMTHGSFAVMDNDRNFPTVPGRKNHDFTVWDFESPGARIYEPFPPFHMGGFLNKIILPLYTHAIPVFGPPLRPPSGALVKEILQQQDIRGCFVPPVIAEQLLHEPNGLDFFKKLDIFCYSGGPLSQAVGDAISKVTMICQFYGSTELGQVRQLVPLREDWSYMEFHPYSKLEFQAAEDDAFELVVFADESTDGSSTLNHNYPGVKEWRTKDLFRPHPTKKNLWRFHGRRDDIVVLSNSEKFNPVPMEITLQAHPSLAGVVITGFGRSLPALLVEPKPDHRNTDLLIENIWPLVESANMKAPGHGRVLRSMIIVAEPDKPFARAGKGTIIRRLTEAAYAKEIDALYASEPQQQHAIPSSLEASAFRQGAVTNCIRSRLAQSLPGIELGDEDNFYSFGLDSLKTTEAVANLKASLLKHRKAYSLSWLSADTFYRYPSIRELSEVVLSFLNEDIIPGKNQRVADMTALFEASIHLLPPAKQMHSVEPRVDGIIIALTGSTGSLGWYLLKSLSIHPLVKHIYCLNRSAVARQQWEKSSEGRDTENVSKVANITFLTGNVARPRLGLSDDDFARLSKDCELVIHNAWKVDFNQSLSSFSENIQSVRTLVDWSASVPRRPRIVFISSISSVGNWEPTDKDRSVVPEAAVADFNAALPMGYGESKLVSERIFDTAATQSSIPLTILRVGQICGSTVASDVPWAESNLVPCMLRTSKSLGLVPADLALVDWVPIDKVSEIILELSFHDLRKRGESPKYYNIVNPHPTAWSEMLGCVKEYCGHGAKAIPLSEWVQKLRTFDDTDTAELKAKPALKALNFLTLMVSRGPFAKCDIEVSLQASKTMAALEPVNQAWMRAWLEQWM